MHVAGGCEEEGKGGEAAHVSDKPGWAYAAQRCAMEGYTARMARMSASAHPATTISARPHIALPEGTT